MADPLVVAITPANAWQKVATNVTTGQLWVLNNNVEYLHTHRLTGTGAPTAQSEGVDLEGNAWISSTVAIDVYVWAIKGVGEIRVDL